MTRASTFESEEQPDFLQGKSRGASAPEMFQGDPRAIAFAVEAAALAVLRTNGLEPRDEAIALGFSMDCVDLVRDSRKLRVATASVGHARLAVLAVLCVVVLIVVAVLGFAVHRRLGHAHGAMVRARANYDEVA